MHNQLTYNINPVNKPHVIAKAKEMVKRELMSQEYETYYIDTKTETTLTVSIYKSQCGTSPNVVFYKHRGPIIVHKEDRDFNQEEIQYLLKLFEKVAGKTPMI